MAKVERADSDGVACGHKALRIPVVDDASELRVEHGKELRSIFAVEGQEYLAVAVAREPIALLAELLAHALEPIELSVADGVASIELEWLHAFGREAHDREAMEAHEAVTGVDDA